VSLFTDSVNVYEVHNNGHWYDFGFVTGAGILFVGGGTGARRRRRRSRPAGPGVRRGVGRSPLAWPSAGPAPEVAGDETRALPGARSYTPTLECPAWNHPATTPTCSSPRTSACCRARSSG